ncbi:polysaccharide ABC transporter ATP-binding protein [Methylotuvimicrobium sp.]|uniref:ABC transporter ATP-binding protein n=1 Tax=Methylotuvimicrobium sp. TaxID=2822413 RepID=UPI003D647C0B
MHEPLAIRLQNVSKTYRLHGSQRDQLIDVLRLQRFGIRTKTPTKEFSALSDISLDVPRGHRIGIVGRNGAGKTTLLKLICGNFAPSLGSIEVNGTVQALMNIGLGFHPEYTGRENVEASLQYNGLGREEYQEAMDGIIEFCELGDFLDQPFKTYSLGMQARLMFAAATAIRPDILIVDEVLGAGDAYFVAKSKARVEKLVSSGCTMLLVSHSMQQVLELCDEAIWLDQGRIRMQDESFLVVKAYEEYLHGPIDNLKNAFPPIVPLDESLIDSSKKLKNLRKTPHHNSSRNISLPINIKFQEPNFIPHTYSPIFDNESNGAQFDFVAPGGISRWNSERGVKICGFSIFSENGRSNKLISMRPCQFVLNIIGEEEGDFSCRYGIVFNDLSGNCIARIYSPPDNFRIIKGQIREVSMTLNPLQIGPGEYTIGISVLEADSLELLNSSKRYDLLGRSFSVTISLPETYSALSACFIHSAEWNFENA